VIANTTPQSKNVEYRIGNIKNRPSGSRGAADFKESESRTVIFKFETYSNPRNVFEPSPAEIKRMTAEIRKGWSADQRMQRAGYYPARLEVDVIAGTHVRGPHSENQSLDI
jgi:hypothetical protein